MAKRRSRFKRGFYGQGIAARTAPRPATRVVVQKAAPQRRSFGGIGNAVKDSVGIGLGAGVSVVYDIITADTRNKTDDDPYVAGVVKILSAKVIRAFAPGLGKVADGLEGDGMGSSLRRLLANKADAAREGDKGK